MKVTKAAAARLAQLGWVAVNNLIDGPRVENHTLSDYTYAVVVPTASGDYAWSVYTKGSGQVLMDSGKHRNAEFAARAAADAAKRS